MSKCFEWHFYSDRKNKSFFCRFAVLRCDLCCWCTPSSKSLKQNIGNRRSIPSPPVTSTWVFILMFLLGFCDVSSPWYQCLCLHRGTRNCHKWNCSPCQLRLACTLMAMTLNYRLDVRMSYQKSACNKWNYNFSEDSASAVRVRISCISIRTIIGIVGTSSTPHTPPHKIQRFNTNDKIIILLYKAFKKTNWKAFIHFVSIVVTIIFLLTLLFHLHIFKRC